MSVWQWLGLAKRASVSVIGSPRDPIIAEWLGSSWLSSSGISITPDTAKRLGAVYACVRVLAETIAALPLIVWRRQDGGKARDDAHPLADVLRWQPNRRQTSFEWREMLVGHTALRGNAYCRIVLAGDGTVAELMPLHPDRVTAFEAPDGRIAFRYTRQTGETEILLDHEVLRFPAWSDNGIDGMSPVSLHRDTFGRLGAMADYSAQFFANNAAPKGAIKLPTVLGDPASKLLRESWESRHRGPANANKLAILDGGMEWQNIGLSNDDAQYVEQRKFEVEEIARIFRVPPHKIGHLERSTNNNIEHQAIEFVTDTIVPWVVRFEQRMNRSLLSPEGRQTHYIGFEVKGLLRGDAAARSNFYRSLFNIGSLSPNDIRRLEDMDEVPGGDVFYIPLNMAPHDRVMEILLAKGAAPADKEDEPREEPRRLTNGHGGHANGH